jgi:predicted Holliday junction resolvase-like endonuclease
MENLQTLLVLFLSGFLVLAILVIAGLVFLLLQTRKNANQQAENKFLSWQQVRTEQLRLDAVKQLENWRIAEIENIRKEIRESVSNEKKVELDKWKQEYEKTIRKDAASKSQSTLVGKITEHFIPYLPEFTFNPQDAKFLGSPIDFIVFDGLSEGNLRKVVFVEIKTNAGSLSSRERQVRDVLSNKNIEWIQLKRKVELAGETEDIV